MQISTLTILDGLINIHAIQHDLTQFFVTELWNLKILSESVYAMPIQRI
jgi:hypothetical protein